MPICQLDLVLDEILHSVVLAEISKLSQLLFGLHDCVAFFELLLKLYFALSLLLNLLHFTEDENLKVDRLLAFFLPLAHFGPNLSQLIFKLSLLFAMDVVDQIKHFSFHVFLLGAYQILNILLMPLFLLLGCLPMPRSLHINNCWRLHNLIGSLVLFLV